MRFALPAVALVILVLVAGCVNPQETQTAKSETVMPTQTTIIQPTFAPIPETWVITINPKITQTISADDPIVGNWEVSGSSLIQGSVNFHPDGTGIAEYSSAFLPEGNLGFTWRPEDSNYTFMRSYTITTTADNQSHNAMMSVHTHEMTSDGFPDGVYLQKVD